METAALTCTEQILDEPEIFFEIDESDFEVPVWQKCAHNYLEEVQEELEEWMRDMIVQWLEEVCEEFRLHKDALFLAMYYFDRFLSHMPMKKCHLQLLAGTCVLIAAKYNETAEPYGHVPMLEDICNAAANTFRKDDVKMMELMLLEILEWRTCARTSYAMLQNMYEILPFKAESWFRGAAEELVGLTLHDTLFLKFSPVAIAATCVLYTMEQNQMDNREVVKIIVEKTNCPLEEIYECLNNARGQYHEVIETTKEDERNTTTSPTGVWDSPFPGNVFQPIVEESSDGCCMDMTM